MSRKPKKAVSHVRTLPRLPRDLVARVLRQVRIALRQGHPDRAIAAIRDNLCGESVESENVEHVPLAVAVNDVGIVNTLEDAGITCVGDVIATSDELLQVRCRGLGAASVAKVRRAVELYVAKMKGDECGEVEIDRGAKGGCCQGDGRQSLAGARSV